MCPRSEGLDFSFGGVRPSPQGAAHNSQLTPGTHSVLGLQRPTVSHPSQLTSLQLKFPTSIVATSFYHFSLYMLPILLDLNLSLFPFLQVVNIPTSQSVLTQLYSVVANALTSQWRGPEFHYWAEWRQMGSLLQSMSPLPWYWVSVRGCVTCVSSPECVWVWGFSHTQRSYHL